MSIGTFTQVVQGGPAPTAATAQEVVRGQVVRAPASADSSLFVVMPGFSLAFPYEIPSGQWIAAGLPQAGADVLIAFDDKGDAWVPIWQGMSFASAGGGDGDSNVDGGEPDSVYGGTETIDGGAV